MSEMMTANINAEHFSSNINRVDSLHHVHQCVLALYLATEHNCSPISCEQFQNTVLYEAVII